MSTRQIGVAEPQGGDLPTILAANVQRMRKAKGWSQEELSTAFLDDEADRPFGGAR